MVATPLQRRSGVTSIVYDHARTTTSLRFEGNGVHIVELVCTLHHANISSTLYELPRHH